MKVTRFLALLLACSVVFTLADCNLDGSQQSSTTSFEFGIFVINEGPFGGTGTITYHDPITDETVQDIYGKANKGAALGQFVQSLTFHNGRGYIVVNGANKVEIVDPASFQSLGTITGLSSPRFFLPINNNQALVSQWGADGLTGQVMKVDLTTKKIIDSIPTGKGPEKMFRISGSEVLVANSGGFGVDSTVSRINFTTGVENARIQVGGKNPCCFAKPSFAVSLPFVLCKGNYLDATPAGFLNDLEGAATGYTVPAFSDDLVSNLNGSKLYFAGGGSIYEVTASSVNKLITQNAYGLACELSTGNLYCADAKDFNSDGEVVIYKPTGEKVGSFGCGIAPGEVIIVE